MDENPSGCPWCEERKERIAELEADRNNTLARAQVAEDDRDVWKQRAKGLEKQLARGVWAGNEEARK